MIRLITATCVHTAHLLTDNQKNHVLFLSFFKVIPGIFYSFLRKTSCEMRAGCSIILPRLNKHHMNGDTKIFHTQQNEIIQMFEILCWWFFQYQKSCWQWVHVLRKKSMPNHVTFKKCRAIKIEYPEDWVVLHNLSCDGVLLHNYLSFNLCHRSCKSSSGKCGPSALQSWPSILQLASLGSIKWYLEGEHFANDDEMKTAVLKC